MWMKAKNGNFVNMDQMECVCVNRMDSRQLVAISPTGKSYVMAECEKPEDTVELLENAALVLNRMMGSENET